MIKRLTLIMILMCTTDIMSAGELVWFDGQSPVTYSITQKASTVVQTALSMFCDDLRLVTGLRPEMSEKATIQIVEGQQEGEGFHIYVSRDRIVVEGNHGRGTAYGILELSRLAGVSPWIWWGDIVPERKQRLVINSDYDSQQQPSVEYRGIFLNDEDWSLRPWSYQTHEPNEKGIIGAQTYKRIFQLLLRLRANTVWPAMHEGTKAFFQTPGAKMMADSCGIVIGTSHCEPLLCNNVGEWNAEERGQFNYRTNREAIQQYWTKRLREVSKSHNNMFTIGMRGIHDSPMEGYKTDEEKLEGMQKVIIDQQQLLRKHIGRPDRLMQVFVPYKEVLQLYEHGLKVPDCVTLMWCDDNYGYMTRYSDKREQGRMGGGGVYYHLSYWGRPHDYLWLCTTQPGLIYNEMHKAFDHHMRRIWIANVHDPKVAAYDLELFLDMAWNIDFVSGSSLSSHYQAWLSREFGPEAARLLAPAMHEYYRLCGERRPEFMGWTQVELDKKHYHRGLSPVNEVPMTSQEAAQRMAAFERIKATVIESRPLIRSELSDAYFAAIEYPVYGAAAMSCKILGDSATSHRAYEEILSLTHQYNEMNHGKWRHLMNAAPRQLPVFEEVNAQLTGKSEQVMVANDAADYTIASPGAQIIQMLGHSMRAVALCKDGRLTYKFHVNAEGDYLLRTMLIPTHPIDNGDLRYSISIDGQQVKTYSLKEPFRSERWKLNVLCGQTTRNESIHLTAGIHHLTLQALDEHIVVDKWMLIKPK